MRALILAGSVLLSFPAFACMNGMRDADHTPSVDLVARRAVMKLQRGDYLAAVKDANTVLNDKDASGPLKHQARRTLGFAQIKLALYKDAIETLTVAHRE